jgi:dTMP kinase
MSDATGRLVVLEGPDGVGKSSLLSSTIGAIKAGGEKVLHGSFPGRSPGTLGKLVYDVHHRPGEYGITSMRPMALQTLHVAAHIDAIETWILPSLATGQIVILDRYWWSTWVYGIAAGVSRALMDAAIAFERVFWGSQVPTLLLHITRDRPLRVEEDTEGWQQLRELYTSLALEESPNYRVAEIRNSGAFEDAEALVRTELARVGILVPPQR